MSARGEPDLSDLLDQALQRAQTSGLAFLSPLGPLLMAAAALGLAKDSRGFAGVSIWPMRWCCASLSASRPIWVS